MKQVSFVGWSVAIATGLVLAASIAACETDTAPTVAFERTEIAKPDAGAYVPPELPDGSTTKASDPEALDAGVEAGLPAACDDGKVDPGETCDPLASCPSSCPSVQCQVRTLEGAGTCGAKCTNTTVQTACVNGDGCCPAGSCNKTNDDDCDALCGNTVLEAGETCDPLASCPTSCPALGCQLRTLQGAGTCAAQCVNSGTQTACASGDGCCPAGCNANNDTDCGPGCGNNVIEGNETCDPLASCPTSCPQVQCQLRTLQNAGTCQAQCVNAGLQTACVNSDGCCPAGCNANNDHDCQAKCGNSVIEKGETCDPLGSCPRSCPQIACQLRKLDNAGTCQAVCSAAGFQTACVNNDGCCPKDCNANNDNDCKSACGNNIVEPGETCDPPGSCPACKEQYTCYQGTGSAATCNVVCHNPITQCGGLKADACCPFDGAGGCNAKTDAQCNGGGWKWLQWPTAINTTKGCVNVVVRGIVPGGSYDFTTCAPPGASIGTGDPVITQVMDDSQVVYDVGNDNCTDPTALPNLAKSECKNKLGEAVMACASPSPGGFIAQSKASAFQVTICSGKGGAGATPLYIWYNAPQEPAVPKL